MGLNANKVAGNGGNRVEQPVLDAGTYPCRLVQVLDLGIQPQRPYQGQEKPPAHEIMLTYEFLDEFMIDENGDEQEDKPRWLSETMPFHSLQADKARSTKRYYALDPNEACEGDFTKLVGTPCLVTIVNNAGKGKNAGKIYSNIANVAAMRERDAQKAPDLVNPPKVFVLDEPDMEVFGSLPQWLQDKIKENLEFKGSKLDELLNGKVKEKKKAKPEVEEPEDDDQQEGDEPW